MYTPRSSGGSSSPQLPAWTYTAGAIGAGKFTADNAAISSTTVLVFSQSVALRSGTLALQPQNTVAILTDSSGNVTSFWCAVGNDGAGNLQVTVVSNLISNGTNWSGVYTLSFAPAKQTATDVGLGNVPNVDATNATNISSGTLPDGRFPATLPAVSGASLTGITAAQVGALSPSGDGSSLTGITAGQISGLGQQLVDDTGWTANADGGDKTSSIPSNATLDAMQAALNLVVAGFGDAFVATADKVKALETVLVGNKLPNA